MLVKFTLPTHPAGSAGGMTLYKNGSQFAARARAMPVKVRSNAHTAACNLISVLSVFWETPLTNADRIGWGSYAYNTPLLDAYNAPKYIRGYAHYMRSNRPRLQHGMARIDTPPATNGLPTYTQPTGAVSADGTTIAVHFTATDTWATQDGAALLLWSSGPAAPLSRKPLETYAPLGKVLGSSTITPTSPLTFATPKLLNGNGVSIWLRSSVTLADGRLSGR